MKNALPMKLTAYSISENGTKKVIFSYEAGCIEYKQGAYHLYGGTTLNTLFKVVTPESTYTWELDVE